MSNNRIFSGIRFQTQGRTVNLTGTMLKRSSITFNSQGEIQQASPFANYNCKLNESNASEFSTLQDERINQDIMRQIAKQEISKIPKADELNRKAIATLQAQITDLKEKISENDKDANKKIQEMGLTIKEDIRAQAQKVGKEVQIEISTKLRLFFQKVNAELKKDILKNVEEEYLSMPYGEDLENRLGDINEKIETMNNLIHTKQLSQSMLQKKAETVSSNQNLEIKLNKIEKELENTRKIAAQFTHKLKNVQDWRIEQEKDKLDKEKQQKFGFFMKKLKEIEQQNQFSSRKSNELLIKIDGHERDLIKIKEHLAQVKKGFEQQKLTLIDLTKNRSNKHLETESTLQIYLKNDSNLQSSINFQNNSALGGNELLNQIPAIGNQFSDFQSQQPQKSLYQVDKDGYLMDGSGKYLLTQSNALVKLSNQQIACLMESKVIQIIEK